MFCNRNKMLRKFGPSKLFDVTFMDLFLSWELMFKMKTDSIKSRGKN